MNLLREELTPRFVAFAAVRPGDSIERHVDTAIKTWCTAGHAPFVLTDEAAVEILNPITRPGTMRIDLAVEEPSAAGCTYAFTCSTEDGSMPYARGERVASRCHRA